jgi:hypothetical protein
VRTFVVPLWVATDQPVEADEPLLGIVEHVDSGRSTPFGNEDELLAFLRKTEPAESTKPAPPTSTT